MAGTDSSKSSVAHGPRIILVEPQLGENIGAAARAMANCGLADLVLVRPRDPWPNERARAMASGAEAVLETARLCETTEAAVADLTRIYATSARPRDMIQRVVTPRQAAAEMGAAAGGGAGDGVGVLFGPERTGLVNEHLTLADTIIEVPLNPAHASLNLAQAVLIVAYEWYQAADATPAERLRMPGTEPADKAALMNLFGRLEGALDAAGFFPVPEMRPSMTRSLRALLQRARLTDQEVRTLHGVVSALAGKRRRASDPGPE